MIVGVGAYYKQPRHEELKLEKVGMRNRTELNFQIGLQFKRINTRQKIQLTNAHKRTLNLTTSHTSTPL